MHPCARISARCIPRVYKPAARTVFTTPFFPQFGPSLTSDLAPLFRLLDTATTTDLAPSSSSRRLAPRAFTPRFDVREVDASYELQGELPGIEQRDLEIEFVDDRTLVIRGKTASEMTRVSDGVGESVKAIAEGGDGTADNGGEKGGNYRKPSVADEEYVDAGAESAGEGGETPSSSAAVAETKTAEPAPHSKYWISERSIGEFERRFSFPGKVDQDAVKASLRNGILSIVIPKVVARAARKINIE